MHVSLETLRCHIDYTAWASQHLLNAASELNPSELTRDFGTGDKSILGTLLQICSGDTVWIERIHGTSLNKWPYDEHATLAKLQSEWPQVLDRWKKYVSGLTEESAEAEVAYLTFTGDPFRTPVWQIILHVVNHGTHHRGQAAGFLRSLGKKPPTLDLIQYYRQLNL